MGIQKYWELFFYWAELVSLNFTNFFAEFWLTAVYWVPPSNMVFQAYCLTFFFFFSKPRTVISAPFWAFEKRRGFAGGNPENSGNFFLLGRAGFLGFQELFCRILVCGGIVGSAL